MMCQKVSLKNRKCIEFSGEKKKVKNSHFFYFLFFFKLETIVQLLSYVLLGDFPQNK